METALVSFTLQPPGHVVNAVTGVFTKLRDEEKDEVVVNLGTYLALYQHLTTPENDYLIQRTMTQPMFCHVFNIATISLPETSHDFLAITADSGNITVVDLLDKKVSRLFSIPFGKPGMRRVEPGLFLSVSPCGRAMFTAAIEKYKLAWTISKSDSSKPIISSPIESARSKTFVFAGCPLDVGYECPLFAFIEKSAKTGTKKLVIYELDTGINCVNRKIEHAVSPAASHLVPIPGPLFECPGGVVVCGHGSAQYVNMEGDVSLIPLPMRRDTKGEKHYDVSVIVASAVYRKVGLWFALLQNQYGDLFLMQHAEDGSIEFLYFDTIPISSSLVIMKQGILMAFLETGDTRSYTIAEITGDPSIEYEPSSELKHLNVIAHSETMSRLTKMITVPSDGGSMTGDLVSIHGSGEYSSFRVTKRGTPVETLARITIGGPHVSVMTVMRNPSDAIDSFMLLSQDEQTRVFAMSKDGDVKETRNHFFVPDSKTIDVFMQSTHISHTIMQVHQKGMRVILDDNSVRNWTRTDGSANIVATSHNTSQMALVFDDSTITLFECNEEAIPIEVSSAIIGDITGNIIAVAIPPTHESIRLTKWMAVATDEMAIYIVSIESHETMWQITARQMTDDPVSDVAFLMVPGTGLVLHIGQENGVLVSSVVDDNTGELGLPQRRFLGHQAIRFKRAYIDSAWCLIANSTSPWIISGWKMSELSTESFVDTAPLTAAFCPSGGFVGITETDMVFSVVNDYNLSVDATTYMIPETPRHIVRIDETPIVFILCSDCHDGTWESSCRTFNLEENAFGDVLKFESGMMVTSAAYHAPSNTLVVGLAKDLKFNPRSCDGGQIVSIDVESCGIRYTTAVEDIPGALSTFHDCIIAGIGKILRIYREGAHQLLKRCESRTIPRFISFVATVGNRIIVGDSSESFHFMKLDPVLDVITPFCDDSTPRFPLAAVLLDDSSVACGDRFGNFTMLRVPADVADDAEVDPSGVGMIWEHHDMCGCPNKLDIVSNFHVGDPITSISLSQSGSFLVFGTVSGQIGAMIPFKTSAEYRLMKRLESALAKKCINICGRMHEQFRSYYAPQKNVCDGDLLTQFLVMSSDEQCAIADEIESTPFDISRMLTSLQLFI